jgi:hypothetical protein
MISYRQLISEQLYYQMKEQNKKIAKLIAKVLILMKDFVKTKHYENFKNIPIDQFITSLFQERNPKLRKTNLHHFKNYLSSEGYSVDVIDDVMSVIPDHEPYPGLYFGPAPLFDEETQKNIKIDFYFTTELGQSFGFAYASHSKIMFTPDILVKTNSEIYGIVYHEMIHATQPNKSYSRRYRNSRVVVPRPGRVGLEDFYNYMRAKVEFEATLAGVIETIKDNFEYLYNKAPNDALWQRTRNIQLDAIKKISTLDRKAVLREFSINYTEENDMPYPNSIIPTEDVKLLEIIYYASIGEEKTATSNVGRLRWNQLINAFKQLYKELSRDKAYATK